MKEYRSLFEIINLLSQLVVFELYDFDSFLKKLIRLLTKIIEVDSVLIYFADHKTKTLNLIASKRMHKDLIGKIIMKEGEGITGWVAVHMKPVVLENEAYKDKRFKNFKELPEDRFEAFLSLPIIDKEGIIGVINLQNRTPVSFSKDQIHTLEAVVKIIAAAFTKIVMKKKIDTLEGKLEERKLIEKAKGALMKERKISERQAYEMIRSEAMKKRKSMREIAEAVLLLFD